MKNDIKAVIKKAISENWYDKMNTSDLQGVCEAEAMSILRKTQVNFVSGRDVMKVMKLSDKILKGIYREANQ